MFVYKKDGVDIQLKEEFMKELVLFVNTAKAHKMDIPTWLEDSSKTYEKVMVKEELGNMIKDPSYDWFNETVDEEMQKDIFEDVANRYVDTSYSITPEMREGIKPESLKDLLILSHYDHVGAKEDLDL